MGRYYSGDIEGKFWFAIQSSDDADYFGVEGVSNYLGYYFDKEDNYQDVLKGLERCVKHLGKNQFDKIHKAFSEGGSLYQSYSDKSLADEGINEHQLEWYARWRLGNQIKECLDEQGYCSFEAEL
tara:strand:- start:635 stop:1009 length:375 start_codon:yes stop_codon:yes gene_type:complete